MKLDFRKCQFGKSAQLLNEYSRQTFCPAEQQGTELSPTHTNPNVIFCEPSSWLFPLQISLLRLVGANKRIVPSGALSNLPLHAMLHDLLNLYFPHQPIKSSCEDLLLREHRPSWQSLTTSEVERCTLKYVSKDSRILWCILNLESNLASKTQKTGKQHCHLPYLPYLDWIKKKAYICQNLRGKLSNVIYYVHSVPSCCK